MNELVLELKESIIEYLGLEGLSPEEIDADAPLFGEGLELDSIDALELVVLLDRNFGIKIEDMEEGQKAFASVTEMAKYVVEHRQP